MIRNALLTFFLSVIVYGAFAGDTASLFVVAHQDDWQLFMGLEAFNAMNSPNKSKVVFIHTTAGDASCDGKGPNFNYYYSRELGAIYSIQFCLDIVTRHTENLIDTVQVKGHNIRRMQYENVVDYFMRLPDGCNSCGLHGESLEYLKTGKKTSITAVDSSATYNSWEDLTETIAAIIKQETANSNMIMLNISDINATINPQDHPDHIHSALAALDAVKNMDNVRKRYFIDYHSRAMPINLSPEDAALKAAIYGVTEFGRARNSAVSGWSKIHANFLSRSYSRTELSRLDSMLLNNGPGKITADCMLYPNPATDVINLVYKVEQAGNVTLRVSDMSSKTVLPEISCSKAPGSCNTKISIDSLTPGSYLLSCSTPTYTRTIIFVKK